MTCAAVLGSLAILLSPSALAAQTADAKDNPAVVQTPAPHQHDHAGPSAEVKTDTGKSCCAKAASGPSHADVMAAAPAADQQSDAKATSEKGCCGGMMSNMKKDQPAADHASTETEHSCCCKGMKM
jgi:hypothetical protein